MPDGASRDPIVVRLASAARSGERILFALGTFRLIHAGTVRYLRHAREGCDRLFAVVLPLGEPREAVAEEAALLKPAERARVLEMLREVEGTVLADSPGGLSLEELREAAPGAAWTRSEAENDVDDATLRRLERMGVAAAAVGGPDDCTTEKVLARVAR